MTKNKVKAVLINFCLEPFFSQKEKAILLVRSDPVGTKIEILREHILL